MDPIRVVHIDNMLTYGGAEQVIVRLMEQMRPDEFELTVVGLQEPSSTPAGLFDTPHEVICLGIPSRLCAPIRPLARLLREKQPHVVHCHLARAGIFGRIAARMASVPVVVYTLHNFWRYNANSAVVRLLDRWTLHMSDAVACVSEAVKRTVPASYRRTRPCPVIYNGVDVESLASVTCDEEQLREEFQLGDRSPLIGLIGRIDRQKGHAVLLQAMPRIVREFPEATALFVGDGPLEEAMKALAEDLGVRDSVRFLGFRDNPARFMKLCDLTAMPSLWEGLSMVLLETCAVGTPVICSDLDVFEEIIEPGQSAITFTTGDPEALADSIIHALTSPEQAAAIAREAQRTVVTRFSSQVMAKQYADLYRSLLSEKQS